MKVQQDVIRCEVYLIRMVHVSDRIQSFTDVADRQENVSWSKMIEDAIDEFDG
jgi:hypothetical protein